jgi:hypothetical protein
MHTSPNDYSHFKGNLSTTPDVGISHDHIITSRYESCQGWKESNLPKATASFTLSVGTVILSLRHLCLQVK